MIATGVKIESRSASTLATLVGAALLTSCGPAPAGRLKTVALPSTAEGREMAYGVYTPPGWNHRDPLPLVVLLHGAGDNEASADRAVVVDAFDRAIHDGSVPPFILVSPRGERGFWVNWHDGSHRFRDWVLDEAVPDVRRTYPTIAGSEGLHLMGVSMGGGGGLQMWLDDPGTFASATLLSAPILNEESTRKFLRRFVPRRIMDRAFGPIGEGDGNDPYVALHNDADRGGSRLTFGAAQQDIGGIADSNLDYHRHLVARNVTHRYVSFPGKHRWTSWAPMFVDALCHNLQPDCATPPPADWTVLEHPER